jgi:hypothetical protein
MGSAPSFIEIVENRIAGNSVRLPVFNATAARVQQEIAVRRPDLRLIEKLIVSDQALTAEVLRFSNSSFYKGLTQVATVRNAIVRLGINEVANIVMMVAHENQFRSKDPLLNGVMRKLWCHALGTAMAAHWLARHCGLHGVAHEAFFAGLLHDVGKLFILTVIDDIQHPVSSRSSPRLPVDGGHGRPAHDPWLRPHAPLEPAGKVQPRRARPPCGAPGGDNYLMVAVRLANLACHKMGIGLRHDAALMLAATAEAGELHLSDIDIAKLEIMLEDSQAFSLKEAQAPK